MLQSNKRNDLNVKYVMYYSQRAIKRALLNKVMEHSNVHHLCSDVWKYFENNVTNAVTCKLGF